MVHLWGYVAIFVASVIFGQSCAKTGQRIENLALAVLQVSLDIIVVDSPIGERLVRLLAGQ